MPIAQEVLDGGHKFYYSVAVVKKGTLDDVVSLSGLRGKKACFPGVEAFAGWVIPVYTVSASNAIGYVRFNFHSLSNLKVVFCENLVNSVKQTSTSMWKCGKIYVYSDKI